MTAPAGRSPASTAAGLVLFGLRYPLFDRYLWPLIPPLATLLLYVPSDLLVRSLGDERGGHTLPLAIPATALGTMLAAMAFLYLVNSHAFDVARWRAGEALMRLGVPAEEIDAGYEWTGYHATSPASAPTPGSAGTTYRDMWPSFRLCGLVSSATEPADDADPVGTMRYDLNLVAGPSEMLYLYRVTSPDCTQAVDAARGRREGQVRFGRRYPIAPIRPRNATQYQCR
jgi:hypothetical protein